MPLFLIALPPLTTRVSVVPLPGRGDPFLPTPAVRSVEGEAPRGLPVTYPVGKPKTVRRPVLGGDTPLGQYRNQVFEPAFAGRAGVPNGVAPRHKALQETFAAALWTW